ncbi:SEFIR domain-containing protein [Cognaticolwellia aestuarii]|uniref:SEFIR domain-containing protein n=1 Tax=Cognaticolwellia aestuarii TaxID=329993 RepID=UPI000987655A|nr:SEFIR domain-containing protein [Cognaticolwellia aestuarii]
MKSPKVFISYSWSDQNHQELVKHWADRLVSDGVDVILDIYDLKEGDDKYVFMESMVTDPEVTHVLVICDNVYAEKANARKAGVGTESQIISGEVYQKVKQSKFIPIVCEFSPEGDPILPAFMQSRMWINFSSSEAENENWEQLIRLLYGKPQHVKPKKGKVPTFITSDTPIPASESFAKFNSLKQAILQDKKGLNHYRRDFIDSCISYADDLRVRERPEVDSIGEKVLEDCNKLKAVRNYLCDWVLLESEISDETIFAESLIDVLEKLRELKSKPAEISSWNDSWFEAHSVFVYETFLYIVAALLKSGAYSVLNEIYYSHYLMPSTDQYGQKHFEKFDCFYGSSNTLQSVLAPKNQRLYAPAAELIKSQSDREDIPFSDIQQAELLTLLMSLITPEANWYPGTLHYSSYGGGDYPFFIRAAQHKNFLKLAKVTGIQSAEELRAKTKLGYDNARNSWNDFRYGSGFWSSLNMDDLDSLK